MLDGHEIPQFGLGVYEMNDAETYASVKCALEAGYRHIDTAEWYENEEPCGRALHDFMSAFRLTKPPCSPSQRNPGRRGRRSSSPPS
jgi:diketogulonate reductase-like aldo/keto reductase